MSYFRELPNLLYQSNLLEKVSSQEYIAVKNLFRRVKLQDSVADKATLFKDYVILEGQRPDVVAETFYGSADLDWVVILTAGITNIKDQWPLSNYDLNRYVEAKYGLAGMNEDHHYETIEVRDEKNRLILPAGQRVDKDFTLPQPFSTSKRKLNNPIGIGLSEAFISEIGTIQHTGTSDYVTTISNYDYEIRLNEDKRNIRLMKTQYLQQYLREMRDIMAYDESSQYITNSLISTENTRLIGP